MAFSDVGLGGVGYAVHARESQPGGSGTPGVPVTPDSFVPLLDQQIKATWEMVETPVMRGTRLTKAQMERAHLKVAGPISFELNPSEGLDYVEAALGKKTSISLGTPTQTTAPIVTANGVSTITVAGTYTPGSLVFINCSNAGAATANTELRMVSPLSGVGTLVVGQLVKNAATTTGTYIVTPAQTKYANSLLGGAYLNMLPTLTLETNKARQWAWRLPGVFVDKLAFDFTKTEAKIQADILGSGDPIFCNGVTSPAMVDYTPNLADETNALRPLTGIDGFIVTGGDPDATGTSTLRAALGIQNVKLEYNNASLLEAVFNLQHTYQVFPSDKADCMVDYTEIATAKRPDVWEDYIAASQSTSFLAQSSKNYGTANAPNLGGMGFYVPTFRFKEDDSTEKIGSVNTFSRKGEALAPPGGAQDYLQVFVLKPT